jgi:hypothetical protein
MRKLLDLVCLAFGGLSIVAGAGLLMLYWLGPASGINPGKTVLLAGAAGVVLGAGVFMIARGGRTWPAWALVIALVTGTFALGQTAERWLPYVPTLGAGNPPPDDTPGVYPVADNAGDTADAKTAAKTDATPAKATPGKAATPETDVAEGTEITPDEFLRDHIEPALKAISAYEGYTCTFHKREWAKPLLGSNYRLTNEKISLKVRHEPFSAYLHFNEPTPKRGTEALYVEGKNNGYVIAHSEENFIKRLAGTVRVPPTDPKVMADNRYPITNIGLKNLMQKFKNESEKYKDSLKDVSFTLVKEQKIDERPCKVIEIYNPKPEKYPRASARLYIDREWNIPVGFESYEKITGRPEPMLVEYYRYTDIKFNPGFKDIDFDPANPAYRYP